jgi:uncharacterized membrane protein YcfT
VGAVSVFDLEVFGGKMCAAISVVAAPSNMFVNIVNMSNQTTQHLSWVDFSKGICIIGVVVMYAGLKLGDVGWVQNVIDFMKPFRMPDFFLLSGLFLERAMKRPFKVYADKRVVHYLYFFFLWTLIFFLFRAVAVQIGLFTSNDGEDSLLYRLREPYAMLWFIQLLPVLCLVTRACSGMPTWSMVGIGVLLQSFPLQWDGWGLVANFSERFIYFYCGYRFAPQFFWFAAFVQQRVALSLGGVLLWASGNFLAVHNGLHELPLLSVVLGLAGALATIVAGSLLSKTDVCHWLRYLGQNSLVVYLGFYLPMLCFIPLVRKGQMFMARFVMLDQGTVAVLVGTVSVLAALALFWVTRRSNFFFLFQRPQWLSLSQQSESGQA